MSLITQGHGSYSTIITKGLGSDSVDASPSVTGILANIYLNDIAVVVTSAGDANVLVDGIQANISLGDVVVLTTDEGDINLLAPSLTANIYLNNVTASVINPDATVYVTGLQANISLGSLSVRTQSQPTVSGGGGGGSGVMFKLDFPKGEDVSVNVIGISAEIKLNPIRVQTGQYDDEQEIELILTLLANLEFDDPIIKPNLKSKTSITNFIESFKKLEARVEELELIIKNNKKVK